jgi:hypothetical protein
MNIARCNRPEPYCSDELSTAIRKSNGNPLPEEHHEAWLSGEAGKEVLVSPVPGRPNESMAD